MPRLLMVSQPTVAGVAQCVLDWSMGLRELGWEVTVACPAEGDLTEWCARVGLPTVRWESQRAPQAGVRTESAALRRIIDAFDPDLVMLHSSKAGLIGRLVLRGSRATVFVPHAWSFDAATGVAGRGALIWERLAGANWTDLILCVSAAEYARGVAAGVHATYQVTRNGVDVAGVRAAAGDAGRLRRDCGIEPSAALVVCLGRLTTQKGQDVLLRAWPSVPGGSSRQLALVGDGPDAAALAALADDTVTFVGGVDRNTALGWLAGADVVAVPSRWEGMALVPLEALALGTPVVASDVTGLREAVTPDVGTLVPPDDPDALAAALARWLAVDPPERGVVRDVARARAEAEFSLASTVTAVAAALADCADRRRAGCTNLRGLLC
ncbi:MAG: hypothetical protein QG597_4612 [Actinomycetota bacterium]|nr:hypothetical protein [Actinomycetota bacterium]